MTNQTAVQALPELLREGYALDREIKAKTERLRIVKERLADLAEFKGGKATGHAAADGYAAKVVLRQNVRWDQDRLATIREHLPERFGRVFRPEFKPVSAKLLDQALANRESEEANSFAEGIEWAREVAPGAPQVTFERLED